MYKRAKSWYAKSQGRRRRGIITSTATKRVYGPSTGSVVPYVPRAPKSDLQQIDNYYSLAITSANVTYVNLFNPIEGTAKTQRYGDKCNIKTIQLKIITTVTNVTAPYVVRLVLVYDNQTNGAAPATPLPLGQASVEAVMHPDWKHRFTVLYDHLFFVNVPANTQSSDTSELIQQVYKRVNLESFFIGNAGTVADISRGSLVLCSYGSAAANVPSFTGVCRTTFAS